MNASMIIESAREAVRGSPVDECSEEVRCVTIERRQARSDVTRESGSGGTWPDSE